MKSNIKEEPSGFMIVGIVGVDFYTPMLNIPMKAGDIVFLAKHKGRMYFSMNAYNDAIVKRNTREELYKLFDENQTEIEKEAADVHVSPNSIYIAHETLLFDKDNIKKNRIES